MQLLNAAVINVPNLSNVWMTLKRANQASGKGDPEFMTYFQSLLEQATVYDEAHSVPKSSLALSSNAHEHAFEDDDQEHCEDPDRDTPAHCSADVHDMQTRTRLEENQRTPCLRLQA